MGKYVLALVLECTLSTHRGMNDEDERTLPDQGLKRVVAKKVPRIR